MIKHGRGQVVRDPETQEEMTQDLASATARRTAEESQPELPYPDDDNDDTDD